MDYQGYDIEDFVMDLSFQNYCLGKKETDVRVWKEFIIGHPDKIEIIQQAEKLFILLNGNIDAQKFRQDQQAFRNTLNKYLHKQEYDESIGSSPVPDIDRGQRTTKRRKIFLYAGSIAASLLLIIAASYFWSEKQQQPLANIYLPAELTYASLPGERKSFQLPDGSTVLLNGGSKIEISKEFNTTGREISLKGEAYFNVTHNAQKPFIIHTDNMSVKVLGTEFDVKAYPEDQTSEAILIRGSVQVTLHDQPEEKIILKPNHKLVIQNELATPKKLSGNAVIIQKAVPEKIKMLNVTVNANDSTVMETSWKDNRLNFNDETLAEVAVKLERWYGVKVSVEKDIAHEYKFTGIFENETMDETLKALQLSLFFHYRVENGKIFITK